jgi:hypothetical protein
MSIAVSKDGLLREAYHKTRNAHEQASKRAWFERVEPVTGLHETVAVYQRSIPDLGACRSRFKCRPMTLEFRPIKRLRS